MFSVVIATHDSERALVPTLAALVPGATAGLIREVIVADAGSRDDTAGVADVAGCRFVVSSQPLGARLAAAAGSARGTWLMFLTPGVVPEPTWIDETIRFVEDAERSGAARAAVFAARAGGLLGLLRRAVGALPRPAQGLLIPKLFYGELGGHRVDAADPETDLLRRVGRRRIATLRSAALPPSIDVVN
jgi:glycosyltransferase involved in cell wall biosynthesis